MPLSSQVHDFCDVTLPHSMSSVEASRLSYTWTSYCKKVYSYLSRGSTVTEWPGMFAHFPQFEERFAFVMSGSKLGSYNKSQQDALFLKFILVNNSTCFEQIYCPSSGVSTLYSQQ